MSTVSCLPALSALSSKAQSTEVSMLQGYGVPKLHLLCSNTVVSSYFYFKLRFLLSFV